nr:Glucose-6-phosphate isomerase [Cupriavidus sp.]
MATNALPSFPYATPELNPAWQAVAQIAQGGLPCISALRGPYDPPSASAPFPASPTAPTSLAASATSSFPATPTAPTWTDRDTALQFSAAGITLDARNQALGRDAWQALLHLAETQQVFAWATAQRQGLPVNTTEGRPALHCLLRADPENLQDDIAAQLGDIPSEQFSNLALPPPKTASLAVVFAERERMLAAAQAIREREWKGFNGAAFTDVVNIGIGGSDLGPRMAVQALAGLPPRVHFLSNPDAWNVQPLLATLNPATTLFILQSKSFTTPETQRVAATAQDWLAAAGCPPEKRMAHWAVVTARADLAQANGFLPSRIFPIWPWVGGRTSVWSSIGLPLAVAIGPQAFRAFLSGGRAMDAHFWSAPADRNMPLAMALIALWNRHFLGCPTQVLAVYNSPLAGFVPYLQQLEMESLGKRTHINGQPATVATGAIVWGGLGIDGQHAYFQLLHQGQHRVPVDFLAVTHDPCPLPTAPAHQAMVHDNLRAQARALALGRSAQETAEFLRQEGLKAQMIESLTPHRSFPGNVPNSSLWLNERDPFHLGALIALYEHKVFCQAMLCQIQPFDQWGVELGKSLLPR